MSNIHVLEADGGRQHLVFHIAIPAGNNPVGTPWRTALITSGKGGTTILKDGDGTQGTISAAEKALIQSGALWEYNYGPKRLIGATGATLDALFTATSAELLAGLQLSLTNFGATR